MDHSTSPSRIGIVAFDQAIQLATQGNKSSPRKTKRGDLKVEDLVLKSSWLARYWGLAAKLGVYPHIAHKKHVVWANIVPLPLEVVISAGQKAKSLAMEQHPILNINDANLNWDTTIVESHGVAFSTSNENHEEEITTNCNEDGLMEPCANNENNNIHNQLLVVEEGLKELVELKAEEAVMLKISQNQNPTLIWLGLSREQAQDIRFKQAWLVYYWRRAHLVGMIENDVVVDRLLYWMDQTNKPPSYEDSINVQRGIVELRSLGIENQGILNGHICQESLHNNPHLEFWRMANNTKVLNNVSMHNLLFCEETSMVEEQGKDKENETC